MNVIRFIWDFRLNQYPDGIIKKSKDRLCASGDMKLKRIYSFETYAPVFQWNTVF